MTQGIETSYAGITFRSRLDARWAAMFNLVGWRWTYEPFDGAGYIPDFTLDGPNPLLIEINPAVTIGELLDHLNRPVAAMRSQWPHAIAVFGGTVEPSGPMVAARVERGEYGLNLGAIAAVIDDDIAASMHSSHYLADDEQLDPDYRDQCLWWVCTTCNRFAIRHELMFWRAVWPCGHTTFRRPTASDIDVLDGYWADASNRVRWNPRGRHG
ncbi:MAG: hypothetical protein H0W25_03450 [Acidimicrobiia bacterium]|nr:hypothetical protein [Acidimicrobiia bacterium]